MKQMESSDVQFTSSHPEQINLNCQAPRLDLDEEVMIASFLNVCIQVLFLRDALLNNSSSFWVVNITFHYQPMPVVHPICGILLVVNMCSKVISSVPKVYFHEQWVL